MRAYLTAAALLGLVACQAGEPIDPQRTTQPIRGGDNFTSNYESVCGMMIELPEDPQNPGYTDYRYCSCSLVAPDIVLTAAECIWDSAVTHAQIPEANVEVRFGADLGWDEDVGIESNVVKGEIYRYFDPSIRTDNLALLVLDEEPSAPIVTLNEDPLTQADILDPEPECNPGGVADDTVAGCVTLVGFGETAPQDEDFGSRKKVVVPLASVSDRTITAATSERATCYGDTGGPAFMDLGSGLVQVAVNGHHNSGTSSCTLTTVRTRVDRYAAEFIYAFIDQYDAVCGSDGLCCETEGTCNAGDCRTPDPDCDPCAWTGNSEDCEEDCPGRDWDCPIGSYPGDLCEDDGDCERDSSCETAPDDDNASFCAAACNPDADPQCPSDMSCDTSFGGDGLCIWDTPSPGSQGYPCTCPGDVTVTACEISTDTCRSGICEEEICVTDCDPGAADPCPENYANPDEPYTCAESGVVSGRNVCLGQKFSGGGGFCTPSSVGVRDRSGFGLGALALFGLALAGLFVVRRRRRA